MLINHLCLQKGELTKVFGEHAGEFLKFCDGQAGGDEDQALSLAEFTAGKITFRLLPPKSARVVQTRLLDFVSITAWHPVVVSYLMR